ncbi:MAG TPA: murein biosynthesis integral membrane protein MurJ, partial [Candidatus Binatus sp.]|uniref:murein biosynthesis integral membrane protein MurJ n=1 Tax=Candidatus Binatus sp. TaxID=2811406 RepID=UPI002F3E4EC4
MSKVAPNQDSIEPPPARASGSGTNQAGTIAAGVLLSRIAGLVRDSIFAHFLGDSATADAFKAGFRIPNILQNLFGEGVLSASFIPVYGKLLGEGDDETADMLAWGVGAIMTIGVTVLVAIGVLVTPYLIDVIAPGFEGDKRELTIQIVRILFPGAGLLVMSAWFLGVLNSHHKFFVSYTAPVAWNVAMIAALLYYGPRRSQDGLAIAISWGSVVGSALQIAVQVPQTLALLRKHRIDFARVAAPLRSVFHNLTPVVISRGVINLTTYVDNVLASLLPTGAVAALNYGQLLYMVPISLFGYSVAASELPAMSRAAGAMPEQMSAILRTRLNRGLRHIAFMVVPSSAAFLILGDVIVAMIYQSGAFTRADAVYVWAVLAGSGVGLLAATMGRLYNSAFYALFDTRTPLRFAIIRVVLTVISGYLCAIPLPPLLGIAQKWGVAG